MPNCSLKNGLSSIIINAEGPSGKSGVMQSRSPKTGQLKVSWTGPSCGNFGMQGKNPD